MNSQLCTWLVFIFLRKREDNKKPNPELDTKKILSFKSQNWIIRIRDVFLCQFQPSTNLTCQRWTISGWWNLCNIFLKSLKNKHKVSRDTCGGMGDFYLDQAASILLSHNLDENEKCFVKTVFSLYTRPTVNCWVTRWTNTIVRHTLTWRGMNLSALDPP